MSLQVTRYLRMQASFDTDPADSVVQPGSHLEHEISVGSSL